MASAPAAASTIRPAVAIRSPRRTSCPPCADSTLTRRSRMRTSSPHAAVHPRATLHARRLVKWTRREFLRRTSAVGISAPAFLRITRAHAAEFAVQDRGGAPDRSLDLAEWSYFWVGVEQAHLAHGTV